MSFDSHSVGVALLNLGTPESPTPEKVKIYLRQFLMDPDVIDLPWILRWPLVNWGILPKRCRTSAEAYKKVWLPEGSPLLVHAQRLAQAVQAELGNPFHVIPAMRYGKPSIESAIVEFKRLNVSRIHVLPLYPQYAEASTGSAIREWKKQARRHGINAVPTQFLEPFYDHPRFIEAFESVIRQSIRTEEFDGFVISFHGLPERQIRKADSTRSHCLKKTNCCSAPKELVSRCYRAHAYSCAESLIKTLEFPRDRVWVGFQSRLGRTPWIRPYTDELYSLLPKLGVKKIAVICPSFVADCLETLEEVQIRGQKDWIRHGGTQLTLIPSLNSHPAWVKAVSDFVREKN